MSPPPPLRIALIGANGLLGPSILSSLLLSPFHTTILTRQSSTSTYPSHPHLTITTIPDSLPHSSLVTALTGHSALVIAIKGSLTDQSLKLITAAFEAGVRRVVPADFGSCCSSDPRSRALIPLYEEKKRVREYLTELAGREDGKGFGWVSVVCGHFLDFGLRSGLMGVEVERRRARVFDGGEVRFSASMLRGVGEAVVRVLERWEAVKGRIVYVQSVNTTQKELLEAVKRVTGTGTGGDEAWEVEELDSEEFIREKKRELEGKKGDYHITEDLVMVEGIVNADWKGRGLLDNEVLGMEVEDPKGLDGLVREALGL